MASYCLYDFRIGIHFYKIVFHTEEIAQNMEERTPHTAKYRHTPFISGLGVLNDRAEVHVLGVWPIKCFDFRNIFALSKHARLIQAGSAIRKTISQRLSFRMLPHIRNKLRGNPDHVRSDRLLEGNLMFVAVIGMQNRFHAMHIFIMRSQAQCFAVIFLRLYSWMSDPKSMDIGMILAIVLLISSRPIFIVYILLLIHWLRSHSMLPMSYPWFPERR